ncbi:hypothetical protein BCR37DRAFT_375881 [Protomyces lactucae-debilis]|uniref:Uncharacterized protein n=1 Tax=Protomyces lactucae-debilis TaxID=2754530 RepID=A0A1Y2FVC3_PROLT|nr:uncharacterized protein BCR37DRAFT_375881 [Protomyces lactucae-debilis]ORY87919.1 hypothetical protein BCR37DRAFT_375881 [Protomyces lactucae-debilis]
MIVHDSTQLGMTHFESAFITVTRRDSAHPDTVYKAQVKEGLVLSTPIFKITMSSPQYNNIKGNDTKGKGLPIAGPISGKADDYSPSLGNKTLIAGSDSHEAPAHVFEGTDDWNIPDRVANQRFFVQIDHVNIHSLIEAFQELDKVMRHEGMGHLISRKRSHSIGGRAVEVGQIGVLAYRGRPIIIIKPGRYWNLSITHTWYPWAFDLTTVNQFNGLTFAQVGQSEAMVCLDPQNQVFVVRNGGFASYGHSGTYKVIEIVDTLNLGEEYAVRETDLSEDESMGRLLGYKKEVRHNVMVGDKTQSVTIATFFNVPAQNTVVIQNGGHLKAFGAGQHVITNPKCTFRGFFTLGERQKSFRTQPAYTLEGVPVVLHVNLRYRVVDAIELTKSYETAFQALKNPAQSAVNAVVSRLSYQQFMRAKSLRGDIPDVEHMSWLEAFKAECMADLAAHAIEYGVKVLSFDVLDRRLEGKLGDDLEKQAESVLKNQMQSTQVALQNRINTETEQGRLEVAAVKAQQIQTEAEAEYQRQIKVADAQAETVKRLAQANADANRTETDQRVRAIEQLAAAEARAIELQGAGYATVKAPFAQQVQLEKIEMEKFKSLQDATVFVGASAANGAGTTRDGVNQGFAFARGMSLSNQ